MALTGPVQRLYSLDTKLNSYPMAASVKAYHGGIAVLRAGYLRPGSTATGDICVGVFDTDAQGGIPGMSQIIDNSTGAAGAISGNVRTGIFPFKNSSSSDAIAQANVGSPCFIVDDETVALTDGSSTRSVAGVIRAVDSSWVWVELQSVNGTALASEISTRAALAADLASATGTTLAGVLGVKQAATVADATVGLPVVLTAAVADGATGNVDVTMPAYKIEVTSVAFNKNASAGGASDTIQLANGATTNYITNAMDINVAANTVVRSTTLLSANSTLAASATLRIIRTKASAANVGGTVVITGVRRA